MYIGEDRELVFRSGTVEQQLGVDGSEMGL